MDYSINKSQKVASVCLHKILTELTVALYTYTHTGARARKNPKR